MGKNRKAAKSDNKIPVFRLRPESNTNGKIKYKGWYNGTDKLLDELVELEESENNFIHKDYGKNTVYLGKIKGYEVTVKIYKCNLTGSFLIANKEYPIFYFNVFYKNQFVAGSLMEYYFTFTMDDDEKKRLNNPKKYQNALVNGKFQYGLSVNQKVKDGYVEMLKDILLKEEIEKFMKEHDGNDDELSEELMETISKNVESETENYNHIFERHDCKTFPSLKHVKRYFIKMFNDHRFQNVINIAISSREAERRQEAGIDSDEEFTAPNYDDVIKLNGDEDLREKFADVLAL
jgi:hypothetical protein